MGGIASILVVDDNPKYIADALPMYGYDVTVAKDGLEALKILGKTSNFDLILLDVMLPGEDGLTITKKLRSSSEYKNIPIVMVTAKDSEIDAIRGLDSGADDYIVKPFGTMELVSRIKALLRRAGGGDESYTVGKLYVNPKQHTVTVDGKPVPLTLKEFELLCHMLSQRGTVFSRDRLLEEIWGYDYDGENRTVDVHIRTLRSKLGECGSVVETVRGVGYKIS